MHNQSIYEWSVKSWDRQRICLPHQYHIHYTRLVWRLLPRLHMIFWHLCVFLNGYEKNVCLIYTHQDVWSGLVLNVSLEVQQYQDLFRVLSLYVFEHCIQSNHSRSRTQFSGWWVLVRPARRHPGHGLQSAGDLGWCRVVVGMPSSPPCPHHSREKSLFL